MHRLAAACAFALVVASGDAAADPLGWRAEWRRFQTWEYVAVSGVSAALFASYAIAKTTPRRHGPILFDEGVRGALSPEDEVGRRRADLVSHLTFWSLAAYPFVVDAVVTATIVRKSSDVAAQMVLIDAEAMAVNGLLFKLVELSVARARPYVADCLANGGNVDACNAEGGTTTSMPSGHVSTAVTGAALICTHHLRLHLHENAWGDALACGLGVGAAIASGLSRIASDNHYASDVAVGALIGLFAGWVVPTTLHYGWTASQPKLARALPVVPVVTSRAVGASFVVAL